MTESLIRSAGGLALFLLGMLTMTDGLRGVAGRGLERTLERLTRSPTSGAATGAVLTALIQSSSATTVLAVGFVGSGLLDFANALGIVIGSNVGTTVTGWIVAAFGVQLELGAIAPVALLPGVLARLFARGRARDAGGALAGFALLFMGIDALRDGLAGFQGLVEPAHFPPDTWVGRAELVGIGAAITLVTQSSSAGVALAIVALSNGLVALPQAAALVVGMDVATTATAALATIGASLPARRTGLAHVIYNVLTGIGAFALLPVFAAAVARFAPGVAAQRPELALVAFHTFFNFAGVVAVLPVARPFARLVEAIVRDRPTPFTRRLDRRLLAEPAIAARALGPTLDELARKTFATLGELLDGRAGARERLDLVELAVGETQAYLAAIPVVPARAAGRPSLAQQRVMHALHALDRLDRLVARGHQTDRIDALRADPELAALRARTSDLLRACAQDARRGGDALAKLASELEASEHAARERAVAATAAGAIPTETALERMDAHRWAERVAHHAWRIAHHLAALEGDTPLGAIPGDDRR